MSCLGGKSDRTIEKKKLIIVRLLQSNFFLATIRIHYFYILFFQNMNGSYPGMEEFFTIILEN